MRQCQSCTYSYHNKHDNRDTALPVLVDMIKLVAKFGQYGKQIGRLFLFSIQKLECMVAMT